MAVFAATYVKCISLRHLNSSIIKCLEKAILMFSYYSEAQAYFATRNKNGFQPSDFSPQPSAFSLPPGNEACIPP
jgi:hypothetical protein